MIVIGLTGGIGTGKSTVSQMLASLGAVIIDADKLGHQALQSSSPIRHELVAAFGQRILKPDGQIDRARLGEIVFNDPRALKRIDEIMHPALFRTVETMLAEYRRKGEKVAVVEAAALIEAKWMSLMDEIWVTTAPERTVVGRLRERSGLSEEQTLSRIRSQITQAERQKYASVVINTDCSLDEVRRQVEAQWQRVISPTRN